MTPWPRRRVMAALMVPLLVAASALAATAADDTKPTVAVFQLEVRTGVSADTAKLLTDNLVDQVRLSSAFSRVVASSEIEAILGFEKQKQLLNCDQTTCMAELAGALGVNLIMVGSLGKLGGSFLINLKLIDTRTGTTLASVSQRTKADSEEALLDAIPNALDTLLQTARLAYAQRAAPPSAPSVPAAPMVPTTPPTPAAPATPTPATDASGGIRPLPVVGAGLAAVGGAGVLLAPVVGALGMGMGTGAVALKVILNTLYMPGLGSGMYGFQAGYLGLGVAAVAAGVGGLLGLGVALVLVLAGLGVAGAGLAAG